MSRVQLAPPAGVLAIAQRLENAGYETWCVGGAVRDALLGHAQLDWDLATAATPVDVQRLFRRTVPVGVQFGTVGVIDRAGVMHEVTTFRRDVRTDGRHAEVEFGVSLDDDLARRDFTINAIAYSPARAELRDPFGGRADLAAGVVRAVGVATERMREDRLRALRAIRFAARFEFTIEPATWAAVAASAPELGRLSPERVREEIEKTLAQVVRPSTAFALWRSSGALAALVPTLATASPLNMLAADCLSRTEMPTRPQRAANRFAVLWLGSPRDELTRALRALRCSNQQVRWVTDLAERWARLESQLQLALSGTDAPSDAMVRRWAAQTGRTLALPTLRLASARFAAEREAGIAAPAAAAVRSAYRRLARTAYRDPIAIADLAVDGNDLVDDGLAPGPAVGTMLARLLEVVVEDPRRNTRDDLLGLARALRHADSTHALPR